MKHRAFIVIDHNIPEFWQNRILDRTYMSQFPGAVVLTDLAEAAQKAGYQIMTADIFIAQPFSLGTGLILTEMGSKHTKELIERGLIPAIITCAESPIIAFDFYHFLRRYASHYKHAFLFSGASQRLEGTGTQFHPYFWPNSNRQVLPGKPWSERKFMAVINSNKQAPLFRLGPISSRDPVGSSKSIYHYIKNYFIYSLDPWMRSDLYQERLHAIEYFSHHIQFDLYGLGWNIPLRGLANQFRVKIRKCYRGTIPAGSEHKLAVLQNYKFSLCFENTAFPGYITEKLFDCFVAGCIPIYYGAPDIAEYVPENTLINFRNFRNYSDLEKYLLAFSEKEADGFLSAAADFLGSPAFDKFHVDNFVKRILLVLDEVREQHGKSADYLHPNL